MSSSTPPPPPPPPGGSFPPAPEPEEPSGASGSSGSSAGEGGSVPPPPPPPGDSGGYTAPPPPPGGSGGYTSPPPPPPGGAGGYGAPPPSFPAPGGGSAGLGGNNTKAVIALVLGVLGIVFAVCCAFIGLLLGAGGAVLGHLAKQEIARTGQPGRGLAQGGFITGIVAVVLAIIMIALGAADVASSYNS